MIKVILSKQQKEWRSGSKLEWRYESNLHLFHAAETTKQLTGSFLQYFDTSAAAQTPLFNFKIHFSWTNFSYCLKTIWQYNLNVVWASFRPQTVKRSSADQILIYILVLHWLVVTSEMYRIRFPYVIVLLHRHCPCELYLHLWSTWGKYILLWFG